MTRPSITVTTQQAVIQETSAAAAVISTVQVPQTLEIGIAGPQGPAGVQGPIGPQGPAGAASGSYRHVQAVPAAVWTVAHGLGGFLNVTVVDSTGREVEGDVRYIDGNTIQITFTGAFSGEAYVS